MKIITLLLLLASHLHANPWEHQFAFELALAESTPAASEQQSVLKVATPPVVKPIHQPKITPPSRLPSRTQATLKGYPIRRGWWSGCPNWQHLTRGDHAGYFDHNWLRSLSWAQLQSLHSDHHEELKYRKRKIHWAYVVSPQPIRRMK